MNYRHAYHAGNFADVLKHFALTLAIAHLKQKPKPFQIVDTHAGCGFYNLDAVESQKTGEWKSGIGQLIGPDAAPFKEQSVAQALAPYLDLVRGCNDTCGDTFPNKTAPLAHYPGSPWFAQALLRRDDKLIANELHVRDFKTLTTQFQRSRNVTVRNVDGWGLLKAVLPPPTRRGLILIDPPFEEPGELARLTSGLRQAVKRFATGIYILWYPIKDRDGVTNMYNAMSDLNLSKLLRIELMIRDDDNPQYLGGCGLLVVNPPYTMADNLSIVLPE